MSALRIKKEYELRFEDFYPCICKVSFEVEDCKELYSADAPVGFKRSMGKKQNGMIVFDKIELFALDWDELSEKVNNIDSDITDFYKLVKEKNVNLIFSKPQNVIHEIEI